MAWGLGNRMEWLRDRLLHVTPKRQVVTQCNIAKTAGDAV